MCWSGEASAVLASIGIGTTIYAAVKKQPRDLWVPLGYFSMMELLQAYTYIYINKCGEPANQLATFLGYLHIAFQPFFINAISMHFIPKEVRKKIEFPVYALCFFSTVFMLIQLYPFDWAGHCDPRRALCGPHLCSVSGNWHIAWEVPTNGIGNFLMGSLIGNITLGYITYAGVAFLLPLLYGSWRITIYQYFAGPFLSNMLTNNINEWPAVWCLLSIAILVIVVKTRFRKILYVKKWFLWSGAWVREIKE